ncbi:MAG: penicillin-binding protein 1C [Deltaproteobacteria bacterium]|nr:penicillin-binding protein 1C [Deltaproteobacteria bacterium]
MFPLPSRKRFFLIVAIMAIVAAAGFVIIIAANAKDYRDAFSQERNKPGRFVTDRNGLILRFIPDEKRCFGVWKKIEETPEILIQAVITAEDHRFFYHCGFDPLAIMRAVYTNLKHGRKVSGASTISQQVIRLLNPRPRTYYSKIIELIESSKLEYQLSKKEILELYLNLVPMGGPLQGVGAASLIYFGKDLSLVSVYEAACLAIIPRAPTRLDPNRPTGRQALLVQANLLIENMALAGPVRPEVIAGSDPKYALHFNHRSFPNEAAHFVDHVLERDTYVSSEIRTTLDLNLQHSVEKILNSHADRLRQFGISQAAIVVVGTEGMEVLAMIGSFNYTGEALGFNNGAISFRSAGSTIKPFLYALALSKGYSDSSQIPDTFRSYKTGNGDYLPFNANRVSYGPVSIRVALGNSLNIPAIKTIETVQIAEFYSLLQRLGLISGRHASVDKYGLGLALGAVEIRLCDLVQAYGCLAAGGLFQSLRMQHLEPGRSDRIFSEEVASEISNILRDPLARILTFGNPVYFDFGFPVALKTGTSSRYRDSWAVAYTSKHVVGVWAGNFDGSPSLDALGASSCGPILKDIITSIYSKEPFKLSYEASENARATMQENRKRVVSVESETNQHYEKRPEPKEKQQYLYLGPAYARWIHRREKEQGLSRFRLQEAVESPRTRAFPQNTSTMRITDEATRPSAAIEIISPHDGDRFVCQNLSQTIIPFRAQPRVVVKSIIWMVDGKEVERTPPPYEFYWNPSRGKHSIHAVTPFQDATGITIYVE